MRRHAPYLVQFQERAHVFTTLVATEKRARAEQEYAHGRHFGGVPVVTIRRSQLLTDGFSHLNLVCLGLQPQLSSANNSMTMVSLTRPRQRRASQQNQTIHLQLWVRAPIPLMTCRLSDKLPLDAKRSSHVCSRGRCCGGGCASSS